MEASVPKTRFILLTTWLLLASLFVGSLAYAQQSSPSTTDAPTYSTLADLLENEQSRAKIIGELRRLAEQSPNVAAATPTVEAAEQVASAKDDAGESLPRQVAAATRYIAGDIGDQVTDLADLMADLVSGDAKKEADRFNPSTFTTAAINLTIVIVATFALFFVLRRLTRRLYLALSHWSRHGTGRTEILRVLAAVAIAALIDAAIVGLAYIGGNLLATFVLGESGELSTQASLFLNAFLVIELIKAGLRMLFASRYEGLRLLTISAAEASYWNRWMARLVGLVGYGLLVVVPLINVYLSTTLARGVSTLIILFAFFYAIIFVFRNRLRVRRGLEAMARRGTMSASKVVLRLLAHIWHWLVILYFLVVLALTMVRPEEALPFVTLATLESMLIIGAGILLSKLLTQVIGRYIHLPENIRQKFPLLERRLNSYIPNLLRVIRVLILIVTIMLVGNAWNLFDLAAWYASDTGHTIIGKFLSVLTIIVVALMSWLVLASLIEHSLYGKGRKGLPSARAQTLLGLFRNALAITLITMTTMIVLSEIGINIGPLIAGAGVLGLAIGFGAQKLVQDIITGIFIQIENAMNTGDVVTVGGITGTAERLSIRSVGIRDLNGTYHIVPFSSVDTVSNYMREFAYHVGEYRIAYRENIDEAIVRLREAFDELANEEEYKKDILDALEVSGVVALADSSVNIRVRIMTTPGNQWAIGRAYNRLVKMHFEAAGITIPYPQSTLYFGEDKEGKAAPARVRITSRPRPSHEDDKDYSEDPRSQPNPKFKGDFPDPDE
ncbi:mechanosensitive channel protein [Pistricoccus aurantiacus]|uniref:Mechanosensitive channel protein n=1 Tax=Pistricoccus aurantiacus TaxID=1883414 RepID=A0A5B8SV40_9GAMM|nr:mechanosensitive channel protein [Pistricoccus aurantiacus]